MSALTETTIKTGKSSLTVLVHANAPVVINFYTVGKRGKRYNRNVWLMKYTTANNAAWNVETMNHLYSGGADGRTYYQANEVTA